MMHFLNVIFMILYIYLSYISEQESGSLVILLALSISYPFVYELYQFCQNKHKYFEDIWNLADLGFIVTSILNLYCQIIYGPFHILSRTVMCGIVCYVISKTFFYLRIFPALTPIVVMINSVIYDLRIFMFFYFLLIAFFCLVFAVLGLGIKSEEATRRLKASSGGAGAISSITEETQ